MVALYDKLLVTLSPHIAWRAAFAIVPVPALLLVAGLVLVFGTDHPAGKWEDRHGIPSARIDTATAGVSHASSDSEKISAQDSEKGSRVDFYSAETPKLNGIGILSAETSSGTDTPSSIDPSQLDIAINEPLTKRRAYDVLTSGLTWLPALAYATTFGYELAIDTNLANVLYGLYPRLGQTKAGYVRFHHSITPSPLYPP
jgi:NNP family nitrate/nitrite transporter-like MFS transporter